MSRRAGRARDDHRLIHARHAGRSPYMASSIVYSLCGMCNTRCPVEIHCENGVPRWICGNSHSASGAALCPRGAASLALYADDERPQGPLIRAGERGAHPQDFSLHPLHAGACKAHRIGAGLPGLLRGDGFFRLNNFANKPIRRIIYEFFPTRVLPRDNMFPYG